MIDSYHSYLQIQSVLSFKDLIAKPFKREVNAMCWNRKLIGNFSEIVNKIAFNENIKTIDLKELNTLQLSEQGQLARNILFNDFKLLKNHGASPTLNLIKSYDRDNSFFPTDVYSFHVDRSPIPTDTFLCTYHGASSDILPNTQGIQKILIPEIRAELKKLYDGPETGFESFLKEYFFDLHYQPKPNAQIINLGLGHLWKLAVDHPTGKVLPCLHRAPEERDGETRLLMIC